MSVDSENGPMAKIQMLVGSIVLSAQMAEESLKMILPFTNPDAPGLGQALERRKKLARITFGTLLNQFESNTRADSAEFGEQLKWIKDQRNNIVHAFGPTYGGRLESGKHEEVLQELRTVLANMNALREALGLMVLALFESLRDTTYRGTEEFAEMAALTKRLRSQLLPGVERAD